MKVCRKFKPKKSEALIYHKSLNFSTSPHPTPLLTKCTTLAKIQNYVSTSPILRMGNETAKDVQVSSSSIRFVYCFSEILMVPWSAFYADKQILLFTYRWFVNVKPGLNINCNIIFSCLKMFFTSHIWCSLRLPQGKAVEQTM